MLVHLLSVRASLSTQLGPDARRLRRVARTPGIATLNDVELLLTAHGLPATTVWATVDQLAGRGVGAPVAWAYAMEYDGVALVEALRATSASEASLAA